MAHLQTHPSTDTSTTDENICAKDADITETMINALDSIGWQKKIVHFPGWMPVAHNKICALTKTSKFFSELFNYKEGEYVIDDAVDWLLF